MKEPKKDSERATKQNREIKSEILKESEKKGERKQKCIRKYNFS